MAKEYDAINNRLFLFQIIVLGALLALYQFSGASAALANGLATRFGEGFWFASNAVYTAVSVFGFSACMFPFAYYSGHVLELHYGLSHETFGEWFSDFIKSLLIDLILATILFSVIYALLRWMPTWWWLASAGFYILFAVVLSSLFPVLIVPLFHPFEPLAEGELTDAIRKMVEEAGIKVSGVFKWGFEETDATAAHIAFTGVGRTKRVVLSDSLLTGYSQEEILAVLAHEVGHHKNRDTARLMVTSSVLAILGFFVAHHCLVGLTGFLGIPSIYDMAAAPVFIFSIFVFSLVAMPFANLHSRRRAFAADAYALKIIGSSEALVSVLEKLSDQNLSNKEPAAWIELLLHNQPSLSRRIQRIRSNNTAIKKPRIDTELFF